MGKLGLTEGHTPIIVTPAVAAPCCWPSLVPQMGSEVLFIPFSVLSPSSATETPMVL